MKDDGHAGANPTRRVPGAGVLAVGSGPLLHALVAALIDCGFDRIDVLLAAPADAAAADRERLAEWADGAPSGKGKADVREIALPGQGPEEWRELVKPFPHIVYGSGQDRIEELRLLLAACKEMGSVVAPALLLDRIGLAGPLAHPAFPASWESAWRRMHRPGVCESSEAPTDMPDACALLANVTVSLLSGSIRGRPEPVDGKALYVLELETLEGDWHPFLPHPLAKEAAVGRIVSPTKDAETMLAAAGEAFERESEETNDDWFARWSGLTSKHTGIFHRWEEEELQQFPLAQCRVQAVDPVSGGPAALLPAVVCGGLTHEEARWEAAWAGIEAYVSRLAVALVGAVSFDGIGAGESVAEAIARGLQACLDKRLAKRSAVDGPAAGSVRIDMVQDERCRFYWHCLTKLRGQPDVRVGPDVAGFPVIWVGTGECWYGRADLNVTWALRNALQTALLDAQNPGAADLRSHGVLKVGAALEGREALRGAVIPSCAERATPDVVRHALSLLHRSGLKLEASDLALEPFLKERSGAVLGVFLRETGAGLGTDG
ncbi:bacteriocin maturation protein [Paenibacillus hodogayensis]|uniref:Bacteriocin maturation protein n=1 Tax=Paenibacillus hodogayensis TaxID=279208 RepID=A0ABV5W4F0_9BACL